jgi:predicted nucleotidyltransferase
VPLRTTLPADLGTRLNGLSEAIETACPGAEFVYLFGSVAAGARGPRSDVDLAIHVAPCEDAHAVRLAAARAASRQLGTDAIDVVLLNSAPVSVAGRVLLTRQVLLDRNPYARHRYESCTARLFQDFRIRERRLLAARRADG